MPSPRKPRPRRPVPESFRRVLVSCLWGPEMLGPLSERARMLWLRLTLAAEGTSIPGVVMIGAEELAKALTAPGSAPWGPEEVERVSASIPAAMLRADWRAGVVWLPALLRWQAPASPKNVMSWRRPWAELPATPLAAEIHEELRLACAARGAGFLRAFGDLAPQMPVAPAVPEARVEIRGGYGPIRVTISGIGEEDRAAAVMAMARELGVTVSITPAEIPAVVEVMPATQDPIRGMEDFVPAPARKRGRAAPTEARLAEVERVLAYQQDRRAAAFTLAGKSETPIDLAECRRLIAALLAAGRSVVECETVLDRQYESVARLASPAQRQAQAGWWSHMIYQPTKFAELLRLDIGAEQPAGVRGLAKLINDIAPLGTAPLRTSSQVEAAPLARLLDLRQDPAEILATATVYAAVVAEQERLLKHRPLQAGEVRLVKLWGPAMFAPGVWSTIQTATERWPSCADRERHAVFLSVGAAFKAGEPAGSASARSV